MKVTIDKLGVNGEGVCRINQGTEDGKVCFVPFSLPDELVDIEVLADKKKFCNAKIKRILEKSPDRIDAPCPYFERCGGCNIQHMHKQLQLKFKTQLVKENLSKFLRQDIPVDDVVHLNDFGYRNKMVFAVSNVNGQAVIGMFEDNSHSIVDIEKCLICNDKINQFLNLSKEYFNHAGWSGFDFKRREGDVKYLCVRTYGDEVLITVVAAKNLNLAEYYADIKKVFKNSGLSLIISDSNDDILSGKFKHLFGIKKLNISEFDIDFNLDNRGFFQVNNDIKQRLYLSVLEHIKKEDSVIDAYCGAGVLSAIMANKCSRVIGIEVCKESIDSAKEMAQSNDIKNVEFILADVKDKLGQTITNLGDCALVLDPPKSGCHRDVIDDILAHQDNIKKIIYVSCNIATLGRDLSLLNHAFEIISVTPFDMFPQTKHVETLVCLQRRV